jgi:hypothetical protein
MYDLYHDLLGDDDSNSRFAYRKLDTKISPLSAQQKLNGKRQRAQQKYPLKYYLL